MKSQLTRFAWIAVATFTFVATPIRQTVAGDPVYVGRRVRGTVSYEKIDHSPWDKILKKYVDTNGMVSYRKLRASKSDRNALHSYLATLSTVNPKLKATRNAKLAFWINAYNAVTVEGILQKYPTTSIRNHTAKIFGYNIWHDLKLHVGGTAYSLDTIEHRILRKMSEPRIHFAIVCASIGCPRLLNKAYTIADLDTQLDVNAKDFFSRRQNFRHDVNGRRFYMSAILDWFETDFGANKAAQLRTISKWLPSESAKSAALKNSVSISTLKYDWNLNEKKGQIAGK